MAMREYNRVSGLFWSGRNGKRLRALGRDHQALALYLLTCPSTSWLGIYYLPMPTLCHELGITEDRAVDVLADLADLDFAHYDAETEFVWVPNMARFQIGEKLKAEDKQVKGIRRELEALGDHPFAAVFIERYALLFHISDLRRPSQGPSKGWAQPRRPLRSTATATETEAATEAETATATEAEAGARPDSASADPVADHSPELAEAVAACRGHEYLARMLDPAVVLCRLRAAHPELDLVRTVRLAAARLTPERVIEQERRRKGPDGFLAHFFANADADRIAGRDRGGGTGPPGDVHDRVAQRLADAERIEREALERERAEDAAARLAGGEP